MIVDVPTPTLVIVPFVPTVATAVLLLLHKPPAVASVSAIPEPSHMLAEPPPTTVIIAGCVFTVTTVVT